MNDKTPNFVPVKQIDVPNRWGVAVKPDASGIRAVTQHEVVDLCRIANLHGKMLDALKECAEQMNDALTRGEISDASYPDFNKAFAVAIVLLAKAEA